MNIYPEHLPLFEEVIPGHGNDCVCESCYPARTKGYQSRINLTVWGQEHALGPTPTGIYTRERASLEGRIRELEAKLAKTPQPVTQSQPVKPTAPETKPRPPIRGVDLG